MSPPGPFTVVTVNTLEYDDQSQGGTSFKFYRSYVSDDGRVLYQYGRIGAVGQWSWKDAFASRAAAEHVAQGQLQSKQNKGYLHKSRRNIRVPSEWMDKTAGTALRRLLHDAAVNGTDVSSERDDSERPSTDNVSGLEAFAGRLRDIVAQMAENPDAATVAYAEAMEEHEAIKESVDLIDNYMGAIQDMLVAGAA